MKRDTRKNERIENVTIVMGMIAVAVLVGINHFWGLPVV